MHTTEVPSTSRIPKAPDHPEIIRRAASNYLTTQVAVNKARTDLYKAILDAYETTRTSVLVEASGLTRQRVHQIVSDQRKMRNATKT